MAEPQLLMFEWQPTWLTIKADSQIDGKPNDNTAHWVKDDNGFLLVIPAELGARISHNRAWEILEVQTLTSSLEVLTFPYGSEALADMKTIISLSTGERLKEPHLFAANEVVAFRTDGPTDIRILVREYKSHAKGC